MHRLPVDEDLPGVKPREAAEGEGKLGPTGAGQAGDAEDLSPAQLKADAIEHPCLHDVTRLEDDRPDLADLLGIEIGEGSPHHPCYELVLGDLRDVLGMDVLPVADDRDPVWRSGRSRRAGG